MSHYCVAVFTKDPKDRAIETLLEPYNETDKRYYQFVPVENLQERYEKYKEKNPDSTYSLDQYAEDYLELCYESGVWGGMYNPNGKWDWYSLDGYNHLYDPKEGESLDPDNYRYRKSQIDFSDRNVEKHSEFWDWYVDGKPKPENQEEPFILYRGEWYRERYKTKEQYLKEMASRAPYAYITPDGVWHAPGEVGWFACSDETAESFNEYLEGWEAYLAQADDPYVCFVDCHI